MQDFYSYDEISTKVQLSFCEFQSKIEYRYRPLNVGYRNIGKFPYIGTSLIKNWPSLEETKSKIKGKF
jgi:hypothetical protein